MEPDGRGEQRRAFCVELVEEKSGQIGLLGSGHGEQADAPSEAHELVGEVLVRRALGEEMRVRVREEAQNVGVQRGARCADSYAHLVRVVDAVAEDLLEHSGVAAVVVAVVVAVVDEEHEQPGRASGLVRDDGVEERVGCTRVDVCEAHGNGVREERLVVHDRVDGSIESDRIVRLGAPLDKRAHDRFSVRAVSPDFAYQRTERRRVLFGAERGVAYERDLVPLRPDGADDGGRDGDDHWRGRPV